MYTKRNNLNLSLMKITNNGVFSNFIFIIKYRMTIDDTNIFLVITHMTRII